MFLSALYLHSRRTFCIYPSTALSGKDIDPPKKVFFGKELYEFMILLTQAIGFLSRRVIKRPYWRKKGKKEDFSKSESFHMMVEKRSLRAVRVFAK